MLVKVTASNFEDFKNACAFEHVFGSRALTAFNAYGENDSTHRFWLSLGEESVAATIHLNGDILTVIKESHSDFDEIISDIDTILNCQEVHEIDCDWDLCELLHQKLGGFTESSYYMEYKGGAVKEIFDDIHSADLHDVFSVLQQSHEYYRTHLKYDPWAAHLEKCISTGLCNVYQLEKDGKPVGTGSIISSDDTHSAIAAVAVIPEYRLKGIGSYITKFLIKEILSKGKKTCLISGYDEVAELYKKLDFVPLGRWGELYI